MQKTKIDWADMTWNPVTGCLNQCPYCYAKKIANRFAGGGYGKEMGMFIAKYKEGAFNPPYDLHDPILKKQKNDMYQDAPYPFGFEPTFHRYRLSEPSNIKKPQTIFVCSMADLFGEWVPDEWIKSVFDACKRAPQHRYLFLTKNASRTAGYDDLFNNHKNWWCGISVTNQTDDYKLAEMTYNANRFMSIEPILEPIGLWNKIRRPFADWVIIGAETGNRKGKIIPEKKWIYDICAICAKENVPIFMKESLRELMGDDFIQKYPWTDWRVIVSY